MKEENITLERDLTWNKEQNERLVRKSETDQAEFNAMREELSTVKVQLNTADNIRGSESSLEQLKAHVSNFYIKKCCTVGSSAIKIIQFCCIKGKNLWDLKILSGRVVFFYYQSFLSTKLEKLCY